MLSIILSFFLSQAQATEIQMVKPYIKDSGTYVGPYLRSRPNSLSYDNLNYNNRTSFGNSYKSYTPPKNPYGYGRSYRRSR